MPRAACLAAALLLVLNVASPAQERKLPEPQTQTVEQLAESVGKSVVVIRQTGRDGKQAGVGTGFVVADGLIATNLHVIGDGRPITVETADGNKHAVKAVHATDRAGDLAILRIDARGLTPLPLGDSDKLKQGQAVVVVGNPQGLKHSVVSGVVSGRRDIEGRKMIQLAIPIEPGNSGGPVLDLQGRVQGVVTLKAALTANLGFAVAVNDLKPMLAKPNPVPMETWLTLGTLDPATWQSTAGARWRRRAGRITVEGAGDGFGGRSLLLFQTDPPKPPFEVTVTVKLDDEAGAAGLVFHADGGNVHYGFYPSAGELRLTRFNGPDVSSWKILAQKGSPHYRPGEWNTLKVRVEKEKFSCSVNGQLVVESDDAVLTEGKVGLVKFRDTRAEFRGFAVGSKVGGDVAKDVAERIAKKVEGLDPREPFKVETVAGLAAERESLSVLRERARLLEQQAAKLRELATAVHQKKVQAELEKLFKDKGAKVDLIHAALLVARLDNDEVDVDAYRREVDRMGKDLAAALPKDADEAAKVAALNKFLFTDRGFHGGRSDYYNRSNSYLNEMLDDREGLPLTLAVLYAELGRRIGLHIEGVPLPGHFVVRHVPKTGEPQLIDVFEGGKPMSREDAEKRIRLATDRRPRDDDFKAATPKEIVVRLFRNLMGLALRDEDKTAMLRYLDAVLALKPDSGEDYWMRAVLRFQNGQRREALADVDWLVEHEPQGIDMQRVLELRRLLVLPER